MFSFLNSAMLVAGAAAIIPLLIHLFSRRKMKVVEFSSLKYLQALQKRQVRRIKVRQLLLLIIRTLILLAVAMAFARPVTEAGYLGSHAGVSAVIVYDNSASLASETRDGPLRNLALRRTQELLGAFAETDEVALVEFGSGASASLRPFASAALISEQLPGIPNGQGQGALEPAVDLALNLLENSQSYNRELFVISDFQSSGFEDSLPSQRQSSEDGLAITRYYALTLEAPGRKESANLGITGIDFGGQLIEAGVDFTIGYDVRNYDDAPRNNIVASLFLDDQRVAQDDLSLPPLSSERFSFSASTSHPGIHQGRIEISGDDFSADNDLYFTFGIPETFSILIVDNNSGGEYVRLALEPGEEGVRHWLTTTISVDDFPGVRVSDYDVVALVGLDSLTGSSATRLRTFVRRGGGLLYFAGAGLTAESFNASLSDFTGLKLITAPVLTSPGSGYYTLDELDFSHPVLTPFADVYPAGPPSLKFYSIPKFKAASETRVFGVLSGGHPLLSERKMGAGKVLTFCGLLAGGLSDFAERSFFVPLVIRLAEYAGADLSSYDYQRYVGEDFIYQLPARRRIPDYLTLITPTGSRRTLKTIHSADGSTVEMRDLLTAGVYTLTDGQSWNERFAVNVNPREGAPSYLSVNDASGALGVTLEEIATDTDLAKRLQSKRTGKELWSSLLWLAALLLLTESLLSGEWPGRRREPS